MKFFLRLNDCRSHIQDQDRDEIGKIGLGIRAGTGFINNRLGVGDRVELLLTTGEAQYRRKFFFEKSAILGSFGDIATLNDKGTEINNFV